MIYLLSFFMIALALAGLAVGLFLRKKPLQKSCCHGHDRDASGCRCRPKTDRHSADAPAA